MNTIKAMMGLPRPHRAALPLALMGLLLAPTLGQAPPRALASAPRPTVLVNARGTALTPLTLVSPLFRARGPLTVAWKVAEADAAAIPSSFVVALTDMRGHTRAHLAATTRAGRADATAYAECAHGCYVRISVANMDYAIVSYTLTATR